MSDWGYAERGPLYASLTLAQWVDMLLGEDPDDRAIREAHGFGYQVPDFRTMRRAETGAGLSTVTSWPGRCARARRRHAHEAAP